MCCGIICIAGRDRGRGAIFSHGVESFANGKLAILVRVRRPDREQPFKVPTNIEGVPLRILGSNMQPARHPGGPVFAYLCFYMMCRSITRMSVPSLCRGLQRLGSEPASVYRAHIDEP